MRALGAARYAGMVVGLLLALAPAAHAGLTAKERRAIDVVAVDAIGDAASGVLVTATFRGNLERRIGRRHLKNVGVAMVLHPRTGAQTSAGVLTRGPGTVGQTLQRTRSGDVGVVRSGRKLSFFVAGPGSEDVGRIEVRVVEATTSRTATIASHQGTGIILLSAEDWLSITTRRVRDARTFEYGPDSSCAELYELRAKIKIAKARLDDDAAKLAELQRDVDRAKAHVNAPRDKLTKLADRLIEALGIDVEFAQARRDLALAERVVAKAISLSEGMRAHLDALGRGVANAISKRCRNGEQPRNKPPVITRFHARFAQGTCATCTIYSVKASDPEGGPLSYTWTKTPSTNDAAATNCGTFTPNGDMASWNHPNEGENKCSHAAGEHPGFITVTVTDAQGATDSFTDPNGSADYDWQ